MTRWNLRLLSGILALSAVFLLGADYTKKTPAEIAMEVKAGKAVIIDVREKDEWTEGHLDKARHLALTSIQDPKFVLDKEDFFPKGKTVYLHCKSGIRCMKAANLLEKKGIKTEAVKAPFGELKKAFE